MLKSTKCTQEHLLPPADVVFYTTNVYFPEEMAKTADDWISMLGLVEHPGDEDGEVLAKSIQLENNIYI